MSTFFQALINTLTNGFTWLGGVLRGWLLAVWDGALAVLDVVLAWGLQVIAWVIEGVTVTMFGFLGYLVGLLPSVPEEFSPAVETVGVSLGLANRYFPISEVLSLAAVWGVVYTGLYVYKFSKFVRGGG